MLSRLHYHLHRSAVQLSFASPHLSKIKIQNFRLKDEMILLVEVCETTHAAFPWLPDTFPKHRI